MKRVQQLLKLPFLSFVNAAAGISAFLLQEGAEVYLLKQSHRLIVLLSPSIGDLMKFDVKDKKVPPISTLSGTASLDRTWLVIGKLNLLFCKWSFNRIIEVG